METINVHQAKTHLSALVARAERGEEVIIARANKPVVKLVPIQPPPVKRRFGEAAGMLRMADDFDELPEWFTEHFE